MAEILNTNNGEVTTTAAPEGHDEAMIAKVDAKNAELATTDTAETEQPEKILGKFETQEDLVKAYQELEKKLSGGKTEEDTTTTETDTTETPEGEADEAAEKAVEAAGLDMDELSNRFYETGELAEDDYAALEGVGINRDMVNQYIEGLEAVKERNTNKILSEVGGQESFDAMSSWAQANLTKEELIQYNQSVSSSDFEAVRSAVQAMAFRYQQALGKDPKLIQGKGNGSATDVFNSTAELTAAMKDPRYGKDPAYRKEVTDKLARSSIM